MSRLNDALVRLTVDELKSLIALVTSLPRVAKKADLIDFLLQCYSGDGLRSLYERLDERQRQALAEAVYEPDGCLDLDRFEAKYGPLPEYRATRFTYSSRSSPTLLSLFLYYDHEIRRYCVPSDLLKRLEDFVPEPEPMRPDPVETLPESIDDKPLIVRRTEQDAITDLAVLLHLADQGRIQVSDKTALPSGSTLRLLSEQLTGGDFYGASDKADRYDQPIGPIKVFAWPLLLQAGGLMRQQGGGKLSLSPAGLKALSGTPADTLRTLWRKWSSAGTIDEFSRVDAIRGQKSKGRVMTAPARRRAVILQALQACPIGAWIKVDDFSRFMRAENHYFAVATDPWKLYITDPHYGSLGHSAYHDWTILQLRYLLCFLFEYATTLGIIDVAYIDPVDARADFRNMWGTDDLAYLSRYDGLMYFRLTSLGAYCLDLSQTHTPEPVPRSSTRLSVLPSLHVHVTAGPLSQQELLVLDTWAVTIANDQWQLDPPKALAAVEKGLDAGELLDFLQARDDQPLPPSVEAFVKASTENGKALKLAGSVLLIECRSAEIAARIAAHKETATLCMRASDRHLVVRQQHEDKFHRLVRMLGFGMMT